MMANVAASHNFLLTHLARVNLKAWRKSWKFKIYRASFILPIHI